MRVAILVAEPPTRPNLELSRHAEALARQLRSNGLICEVLRQSEGEVPDLLARARPNVLHVLHALDGTGVLLDGALPPVLMHLHPTATARVGEGHGLHDLRPDGGFLRLASGVASPSSVLYRDLLGGREGPQMWRVPLGVDYDTLGARSQLNGGPVRIGLVDGPAGLAEAWAGRSESVVVHEGDGADLLLMPQLTYGTCSYAALEALARGTPIAAADTPGVRELIRDLSAGVTLAGGDPSELLGALVDRIERMPDLVGAVRQGLRYPPGVEDEAFEIAEIYKSLVSRAVGLRGRPPTRLLGGAVETPAQPVPRSVVRLSGWVLTEPSAVRRVEVWLNGRLEGPARLGLQRPDIAGLFPVAEAPVCGFEYSLDLGSVASSVAGATIDVRAYTMDGSVFPLPARDVELLERSQRTQHLMPAPAAGRPRPGEVKLVAFSHDLTLGGAQLYLWEMLRLLAREPWFSCTVVSPSDGPLAKQFRSAGIGVHITSIPHWGFDEYESRLAEVAAWIGEQGFNMVFANTLLSFGAVDMASRIGLPAVWSIHESYSLPAFWSVVYPSPPIDPGVAIRAEAALASAARLVFEAEATRDMFRTYAPPGRLEVVPYGIDVASIDSYLASFDKARTRERLEIPQSAVVLLCLGTITSRKGQTVLAQAFAAVAADHPDAFCVFVGALKDDYAESLRTFLSRAGLQDRTRVVPVVPDTYQWYGVADLFVSASDVESLPRSVLEAMVFGLPVASTAVFGLPELIEDGVTGHLCEAGDVAALSELLDRHLSMTSAERAAMAAVAEKVVRTRHDSSGYAGAYAAMFRELAIEGEGSAPAVGDDSEGIIETISPYESMMDGSPERYLSVGISAGRRIRTAVTLAGKSPRSILDYACGHGRVMRVLRRDFPAAAITACDIDRYGVDFCAATFDAIPLYGSDVPEELDLGGPYDLIWCGSLLTHLDEEHWRPLIAKWAESLSDGGVVVFTTHGRLVAERVVSAGYGLEPKSIQELRARYDAGGFAYADYPDQPGYGISLSSPGWVLRLLETMPELRLLLVEEAGWDHHQDVIACVRDRKFS